MHVCAFFSFSTASENHNRFLFNKTAHRSLRACPRSCLRACRSHRLVAGHRGYPGPPEILKVTLLNLVNLWRGGGRGITIGRRKKRLGMGREGPGNHNTKLKRDNTCP